jgi:hypothetical protein
MKRLTRRQVLAGATAAATAVIAPVGLAETASASAVSVAGRFFPDNDQRFQECRRFTVLVENDIARQQSPMIPRGFTAWLVDLKAADADIESGRVYFLLRKGKRGLLEDGFWSATVHRNYVVFRPTTADPEYNEREKFSVPRKGIHESKELVVIGLLYGAQSPDFLGPPPVA